MTRPLPRPALQSPPRSPRPPAEAPAEPAAPEPQPETPVEQALPPEPEAPTQPPAEEPVIQEPPPEPEPQAEPPPEEPMDLPEEPPEAPAEPAAPAFVVITAVALGGAAGSVTLTNFGGEPQNLEGWFLCQFPDYWPFPAVELGPGERIDISAVSGADTAFRLFSNQAYGALDGGQGEVALYSDGQFATPTASSPIQARSAVTSPGAATASAPRSPATPASGAPTISPPTQAISSPAPAAGSAPTGTRWSAADGNPPTKREREAASLSPRP